MKVAVVAESFLPNINGVTNSVLRVLEYLREHGHDAIVIAPGARDFEEEIHEYLGFPIIRVPTIMVPLIDSLPIGVPRPLVTQAIRDFLPDVIHLASPFVLGGAGAFAARMLQIPAVAVYQTDVAGFASRYHLSPLAAASWEWTKTLHNMCARTLAPSSAAIADLHEHGIERVYHWGRGVDTQTFCPSKRNDALRVQWSPQGLPIVGFVGRLAAEKGVHRLSVLSDAPVQLVIIGDGPERPTLEEELPNAIFMGELSGEALAEAYASLDVFVHPGEHETFCQAIQEALASGIPAIAPRAGGPIDLIQNGINGYLIPPEHFADQLLEKVFDSTPEMGIAAREGVRDKTWSSLCAQLLRHYEAVIYEATR
ncbi:glycosyltransferase family 4 protein, partial [Corynebacterium freiburgense]|uniref:glycosyltransferase family 4 protein n=1 Tax=Corynebacterium freiburgense TaxID=556548 RepID=UPI00041B5624